MHFYRKFLFPLVSFKVFGLPDETERLEVVISLNAQWRDGKGTRSVATPSLSVMCV